MKILVTGGAGFIGSAVVRLAVRRGHQVVNLDALTYAANLENVAPVSNSPLYAFEQADLREPPHRLPEAAHGLTVGDRHVAEDERREVGRHEAARVDDGRRGIGEDTPGDDADGEQT